MRTVLQNPYAQVLLKGGLQASLLGANYKMILYQNNVAPDPSNLSKSQFTEATFDGYTNKALTWAIGPFTPPAGGGEMQNASVNWTMTGSTTPNTIYGWAVVSTAVDDWIIAGKFADGYPMVNAASSLTLVPVVNVAGQPISGDVEPV